jgi:hypothetical protein
VHRGMAHRAPLLSVLLLVLSAASAAAFHNGSSSCTYASGTVRLTVASQHVVQLLVVEGRIEYADLTDYSHKGRCGSATVRNTDRVRVTETVAGTTRLQIRQQLGRLGPGRTLETTGISEIEVYLGTVTDLWLLGRPVGENVVIGAAGVNLNGDNDVDLIGTSLDEITAFLEDGNDSLSAAGGRGTGDPWLPPSSGYLAAYGDDGNDILRGTSRGDLLDGEFGDDRVTGGRGPDDLRGGGDRDRIAGGPGDDAIDPGPWPDIVAAGDGNDYITAADYTADRIDGGAGSDTAVVDPQDSLTAVETVKPGP